jgi:hypothetical protein
MKWAIAMSDYQIVVPSCMVDLKQPFLAAVETLVLLVVDTATCTARD